MRRRFKFKKKVAIDNTKVVFKKKQLEKIIYDEFFETSMFYYHVKEVSELTGIDEAKVLRVLVSYFYNVMVCLNTIHKRIVKINIYSFFSLTIKQ